MCGMVPAARGALAGNRGEKLAPAYEGKVVSNHTGNGAAKHVLLARRPQEQKAPSLQFSVWS